MANFKYPFSLIISMVKKRFNNKGLSTIVATLLILLLVMVAVGTIMNF